jgi:hypothetical protein
LATAWEEIADGALIKEEGNITEIGTYKICAASTRMSRWWGLGAKSCCPALSMRITMSG